MRIIVAGGRDFGDYSLMQMKLDKILSRLDRNDITIISGGCKGADSIAETYAIFSGIKFVKFPANWDKHGKSAGPIRNKKMAEQADGLVAFWDGKSRGTKNMIDEARKAGLKIRVVRYER